MRTMMKTMMAGALLASAGTAMAADMPPGFWTTPTIQGYGKIHYLANAAYKPDPKQTYRIVFAVTQGGLDGPVPLDVIDRDALQVERVARPASGDGRAALTMVSNGRPLPNAAVRIVDAEGNELPERSVGEIALRSDCMLTEYYRRPDATEQAFLPGSWYRTGDLGYLAGGELYVSGRKKDLIIIGGKNVYPQDIEAAASQVPGVHPGRVVAFGLFDEAAGTEEVALVAEVDVEGEAEREALAEAVRQAVTRSTAVALRQVRLVGPGWIIKTSSGKTARAANKERYLEELATENTEITEKEKKI